MFKINNEKAEIRVTSKGFRQLEIKKQSSARMTKEENSRRVREGVRQQASEWTYKIKQKQ